LEIVCNILAWYWSLTKILFLIMNSCVFKDLNFVTCRFIFRSDYCCTWPHHQKKALSATRGHLAPCILISSSFNYDLFKVTCLFCTQIEKLKKEIKIHCLLIVGTDRMQASYKNLCTFHVSGKEGWKLYSSSWIFTWALYVGLQWNSCTLYTWQKLVWRKT
jgi:hypothetical protein